MVQDALVERRMPACSIFAKAHTNRISLMKATRFKVTTREIPAIAGGVPIRLREQFLVFGAPVIGEPEIAGVVDCLRRRWIGTGLRAKEFEQKFSSYKGAAHAVAVSSGTAALHLALLAMGVGPGDEVITSSMTFCSTVNSIIHTGATPVLIDCDRRSFNINADRIAERINTRTKAIVVVHMCGRCCDMEPIMELAHAHGLLIIEDCAHAIESSYHGTPSGLLGDIGCFSFYATKNLTTAEGGMILTRDPVVASEVKTLANQGMSADAWDRFSDMGYQHYTFVRAGFKYNMPDINAAIGLAQLRQLEQYATRRTDIWRRYDEQLSDLACLLPPPEEPDTRHAHHLYTLLLEPEKLLITRDQVLDALTAENIGAGVHFIPVHQHPYYRRFWCEGYFPNGEFIGERTLSLPLSGDLEDEDVDDVIQALRRILRYYSV